MKKAAMIGWGASIVFYVGCILWMQHAFSSLFSLQGEVTMETMVQIQNDQRILSIGKSVLLILSLAGFACCGILSLKKPNYLWYGLITIGLEIAFSVLYGKWMTGMYLTFAEAYPFQKWFWIVLIVEFAGFFLAGRKKQKENRV